MIGYIKGEIAAIYADSIVLESGSIGYNIFMPKSSLDLLDGVGSSVKVYTYLHVREDALLLYGFLTKDDLDLYKLLISVNGVGPKGALALLSVRTSDELRFAIISGDASLIGKAPGVGPKTAQRVIIDLKDKIDIMPDFEAVPGDGNVSHVPSGLDGMRQEAVMALTALGYPQTQSVKAVRQAGDAGTVEEILKKSLLIISDL